MTNFPWQNVDHYTRPIIRTGEIKMTDSTTTTTTTTTTREDKAMDTLNSYAIAQILEQHADGYTVDRYGRAVEHGTAVGVADSLVTEGFDVWATTLFVYDHPAVNAFGTWFDAESGLTYVDAIVTTTLETALRIGHANNQIAVWDIDYATEYTLGTVPALFFGAGLGVGIVCNRAGDTPAVLAKRNFGLSFQAIVRNILASYDRASSDIRVAGENWYAEALNTAAILADQSDISLETAVAVIAHLSPMLGWKENVENAFSLCLDDRTHGVLGSSVQRARNALIACDPYTTFSRDTGHKIRSFYENILGDTMAVTIDRHACRVAVGEYTEDTQRALKRVGVYQMLAHAYRVAADARDVAPSVMQAVTWCEIRGGAD